MHRSTAESKDLVSEWKNPGRRMERRKEEEALVLRPGSASRCRTVGGPDWSRRGCGPCGLYCGTAAQLHIRPVPGDVHLSWNADGDGE